MESALLTPELARKLLATITENPVTSVCRITNTNDVFKVETAGDGNFYVKFHTSDWYKAADDTEIVVRREAAVAEFIRRKGIPLGYRAWTDCTRQVVSRSVLITSELPGMPIPQALRDYPQERERILQALAEFLRQLHGLEFPRAGYFECTGHADLPFSLDPAQNPWCDSHPCQKADNFRLFALNVLKSRQKLLPPTLYRALQQRFHECPDILRGEYRPPRFVINNYHPFHIHVGQDASGWHVCGLYDFEAASAGAPLFDLVLNELQMTPILGGLSWRSSFYPAYGRYPAFEAFLIMLLAYLLISLGAASRAEVPDPEGLIQKLPRLIRAGDYPELLWYPGHGGWNPV